MSDPTDTPSTDGAPDPGEVRLVPRTTRERKLRRHSERIPTITYIDPEYGVVRDRQDMPGNDLTTVMRWCETHDEVVWLYNDGSYSCPQALAVEHDDGSHVLVRPPFTISADARVVPEDRPAQCPKCGSTDPRKVGIRPASPLTGDGAYSVAFSEVCSDPWHAPAGVPALDDDTRREVEALIVDEVQDSPTATPTSLPMVADLAQERGEHATAAMVRAAVKHLAAYLGGTDGR